MADGFEVLTGLPRPDRWVEARPGVLDVVLERRGEVGDVVVDTGFSLEDDADLGRNLSRNQLTLDAVAAADHVVVVGSAEPTGLARLARTLVELRDSDGRAGHRGGQPDARLAGLEPARHRRHGRGLHPAAGVHFLPEDRATTDKALVAGQGRASSSVTRRCAGRSPRSTTRCSPAGSAQKPPISR